MSEENCKETKLAVSMTKVGPTITMHCDKKGEHEDHNWKPTKKTI